MSATSNTEHAEQPGAPGAPGAPRPLLEQADWNEEWKRLQRLRRAADDAAYWDKRAATFSSVGGPSPYAQRFLELAGIQAGESVLDMGCGTGALAIPLAQAGHRVVAADFSQGMLDELAARTPADVQELISPVLVSWADDWPSTHMGEDSVDVALASRSIATDDLAAALQKLARTARRRCCITLSTGSSPRSDATILAEIGLPLRYGRDFQYAWNILVSQGARPECSYIDSTRDDTFDSAEDAFDTFKRMVDDVCATDPGANALQAYDRLRTWLDANLVPNEHAGSPDSKGLPQKNLRLARQRVISWAFIAWNV